MGREVAAETLAYGWEHWERLRKMDNPVGYLYVVGRNLSRRHRPSGPKFIEVPHDTTPDIEPELPRPLAALSSRQRNVVVLVQCFQWTLSNPRQSEGMNQPTTRPVSRGSCLTMLSFRVDHQDATRHT